MIRSTLLAAAALVACGRPEPRPIVLNEDACAYCRMTIADARFGGEVVTHTGRVETFDSLECLAAWVRAADSSTTAGIYVIDLDRPGTFVDVRTAGFLRDLPVHGPMGHALAAFASPAAAHAKRAELGGAVVTWNDILSGATDASGHAR